MPDLKDPSMANLIKFKKDKEIVAEYESQVKGERYASVSTICRLKCVCL